MIMFISHLENYRDGKKSVVARILGARTATKGHGDFWSDENVLYLYCSDSDMTMFF